MQRYPALLDFGAPQVWAYSRETALAEKFEARVSLGRNNSRMKDFFDIHTLSLTSAALFGTRFGGEAPNFRRMSPSRSLRSS